MPTLTREQYINVFRNLERAEQGSECAAGKMREDTFHEVVYQLENTKEDVNQCVQVALSNMRSTWKDVTDELEFEISEII